VRPVQKLFVVGGIGGLDIRQDRRLHERSGTINPMAARHELCPFGDSAFDLTEQLHQGRFGGQRTERCRPIHRVARFEGRESGLKFFEKFVGQRFDDNESFARDATLAHVVHLRPDSPPDRFFQVGILQHNEGVAAAQFHGGFL